MKWEPVDRIILIIVIAIFITVISADLAPYFTHKYELNNEKFEIVSNTILSLITIVSLYVGSKIRKKGE